MHDPSLACVARGCTGGVSFATCSADGTIRLWDLALQSVSTQNRSILALDQHHVTTEPLDSLWLVGAGTFERESMVSGVITKGYQSMAVSSDGKHLAAGDSDGNLHIFNLYTSDYTCIQDVHEGEVLSLSFSMPVKKRTNSVEDVESYYFLASSGRDKTIHLFDVNRNFHPIASINDHSAPVSSVKLTGNGRKIISCGSDKSLIFHDVSRSNNDYNISQPHQQKASHGTIYDIAIYSTTESAVIVGQDKKINILDIATEQVIRSFKQGGDFGDPIKVCVDPSCSYVVCSYSDRSICMYDIVTGKMVARATGHGEGINGIIFLPDCKHLVSVGSDGCIFVWKVPVLLTSRILQRIKENFCPLPPNVISKRTDVDRIKYYEENYLRSQYTGTNVICEGICHQETPTFRLSVSRLPQWAKSKVTSPFVIPLDPIPSEQEVRLEDHSPSKSTSVANAPVNLSLHTPFNHNQTLSRNSPDPNYSKDSTTQPTCRSFALDKRWFTIHTVCLDLLNSPEVYNVKEQVVPSSSDLSQSPALEETNLKFMKHSCLKAPESSARKCYSARFTVRQDLVRGETLVLDSSIADLGQSTNRKETSTNIAALCVTEQEDSERGCSNPQGMVNSNSLPQNSLSPNHIALQSNSSSSSKSTNVKVTDIRNENNSIFTDCKEALRTLDASSKTALEVLSRLRDMTSTHENNPEAYEAQFYSEVTEMLP
ncbi:uncharacterized protein LOC143560947 [Bidens hawaiensis]|uniref:uncharacterized protein LOC143560947 n=1 Tax=Bidens hawaiensis TaxID=980011 RepID=UPI00404B7743